MGGHLANIGFGDEQWQSKVMEASSLAKPVGKSELEHYAWRDASGARVLYHSKGSDLVCLTPGFKGTSVWDVASSAAVEDADCLHCSGADCDILDGRGELLTRATIQFELFAPFQAWLKEPRRYRMEVCGFVHWAELCSTPEELQTAFDRRGMGKSRLASTAFVPVGMFGTEPKNATARATALLTGTVEAAERRTNGFTKSEFHVLKVATQPGMLDLVAAPDVLTPAPAAGMTIFTEVWLTGRPVERRRGWDLT